MKKIMCFIKITSLIVVLLSGSKIAYSKVFGNKNIENDFLKLVNTEVLYNGDTNVKVSVKNKVQQTKEVVSDIELAITLTTTPTIVPTPEVTPTKSIINKETLILVNKDNKLSANYEPTNLVSLPSGGKIIKLVAEDYKIMITDAAREGVTINDNSTYRSYKVQQTVWNNSVKLNGLEHTKNYVAVPGASEHQTGLAIDIVSPGYNKLTERFENSPAYQWIANNADRYGFIIRYPRGKEPITGINFEPWHIRYVGVEDAKIIKQRGVCLEEYIYN